MTVAVVILAGGEGRRIGGHKPQRMLGGRSLIDRAVDFARALSPLVAISVRDPDQLAGRDIPRVLDLPGIGGPLAGLGAALGFAFEHDAEALLTLPCDAPFLPGDLLARLTHAMTADRLASVPLSDGQIHPASALWRAEAGNRLPSYLETGRAALSGFVSHVGFIAVEWPAEPFDPFFNINSEDDLSLAQKLVDSN